MIINRTNREGEYIYVYMFEVSVGGYWWKQLSWQWYWIYTVCHVLNKKKYKWLWVPSVHITHSNRWTIYSIWGLIYLFWMGFQILRTPPTDPNIHNAKVVLKRLLSPSTWRQGVLPRETFLARDILPEMSLLARHHVKGNWPVMV